MPERLTAAAAEAAATLLADLHCEVKPSREEKQRVVARLQWAIREAEGRG